MLVSEILRIKGNTLFTTTPDGAGASTRSR